MRLFRFRCGQPDEERLGVFGMSGCMRNLSLVIPNFDARDLSSEGMVQLAELDARWPPLLPENTSFGACTARPVKIICVGLNYTSTLIELGMPCPMHPRSRSMRVRRWRGRMMTSSCHAARPPPIGRLSLPPSLKHMQGMVCRCLRWIMSWGNALPMICRT